MSVRLRSRARRISVSLSVGRSKMVQVIPAPKEQRECRGWPRTSTIGSFSFATFTWPRPGVDLAVDLYGTRTDRESSMRLPLMYQDHAAEEPGPRAERPTKIDVGLGCEIEALVA